MKSRNLICILFACIALAAISGCVAENKGDATSSPGLAVPKENLPEGFKLLAALPENDASVNITAYIERFYGAKEIGLAKATVGIYQWGTPGVAFDSRITLKGLIRKFWSFSRVFGGAINKKWWVIVELNH